MNEEGRLIKNGKILNYKIMGSYDGPIIHFARENRDLEAFGNEIEISKLKKQIEKGDCILAECVDANFSQKKYLLTESISEILE